MTKLETLGSDVSIIWFWAGIFILIAAANICRTSIGSLRKVERLRGELEAALAQRRWTISRIVTRDTDLERICRSAETAMTPEEVFACEADLDTWIYRRLKAEIAAGKGGRSSKVQLLQTAADLRPFRDRYNEAAIQASLLRRTLPGALIARSFVKEDLPLIAEADFM